MNLQAGLQISGVIMFNELAASKASENSGRDESHMRIAWICSTFK